jgi:pimeloyl-ACP methyl ester carboxylesterase
MNVRNEQGERLDVLVEGKGSTTVVFVHGFGTSKDEGFNLFVDVSRALQSAYRIVRFDFSSYGKSEGEKEEGNLDKFSRDLNAVLAAVRREYGDRIYILAHSMGTQVTAYLSPEDIAKTVFSAPTEFNAEEQVAGFQRRITQRGGTVNENGISIYPRTNGEIQTLGSRFWSTLRSFNTPQAVREYAKKTELMVIKPLEDDIIAYSPFPRDIQPVTYVELHGNHNFTKSEDRQNFIRTIETFLH